VEKFEKYFLSSNYSIFYKQCSKYKGGSGFPCLFIFDFLGFFLAFKRDLFSNLPKFLVSLYANSWLPFGLFWNGLPEIKCFGLFRMLKKTVYFIACFGEIWTKLAIFFEIFTLSLAFEENLTFIWPLFDLFFHFDDLAFLNYLRPNLDLATLR